MRRLALLLLLFLLLPAGCGGDDAILAMNAGLVAMENDRAAEALPHFEAALAANPDWREARINVAVARFHAGVGDGGVLESRPDDPHALFLTGARSRMAGEAQRAIDAFERLARIANDDLHVWCWLGLSLKDAGRVEEAEAALVRAGDLRPAKAALAVLRGEPAGALTGPPIRGRYAYWSRFARAIRRFPGVDREPGPGENWIEIRLVPGAPPETMAGPAGGAGEPGVEIRAGRCWFGDVKPGRIALGDGPRVDFVRVVWPSGRLTAHGPYDANQEVVIRESDS
ncbi:MAG: tetratricopeptide repeat protein [Planctomycetota bacterium]